MRNKRPGRREGNPEVDLAMDTVWATDLEMMIMHVALWKWWQEAKILIWTVYTD